MKSDDASTTECYVALGSNLGDSIDYLNKAIKALKSHASIHKLKYSNFYQSKPHGPQGQPDYFNAAVKFNTSLDAESLLDLLQEVENNNKRIRKGVVRWGARTLDLDLLFYGDEVIKTNRLIVPHIRICERAFVLFPLDDLDASLKLIGKTSIKECIDKLSSESLADIKEVTHEC